MGLYMSDIKILVVEDDAIEALDIKRTLNSFGYSVPYVASRGEEAISKSLELMPDLILMDIILKGKTNGIEAASKIKDLNIPVIYLTAHSEESTVKKAKLTEPYGYLIKPYDIFELKFAIELAIFKSNQEKKLKESEANFRAIAENASEGILIAIKKGNHAYANQMAAEITGYSIEELLKNGIVDLAHKDEIKKLMGRYNERISGKTIHPTYETKIVGKEGNIIPIEITAAKTVWKGQPADMVIFKDISERKKVEKALKLAGLYNRSLIEASLDPLVTIGPDGKITDVNTATETVTGHSRDELIGTDFSNYFTEPDNARKGYEQVFMDGFVRDYPLEILNKDGHITSVLYNASVYKDESGDVVGVFAAARDITELKRADEDLKESEVRFRSLYENSFDAILLTKPDGSILSANPAAQKMLGMTEGEITKVGRSGIIVQDENLKRALKEREEKGKVWTILTFKRKDGSTFLGEITSNIFTDAEGNLKTSMIIRDVTEREKAKKELELASLYNRSLIEASLDPLVTIGQDGKITDVNSATEIVTGFLRDELIGTDFSDYFTKPDKAREGYQQVFKEGFVRDYSLEIKNKKGLVTPVLYNASLYKDESGKVVGVFAAARDITQRKQDEKELRLLNRKLQAISKCNQTLLRAVDEQTLLNEICRIICEEAGYRLAWVGYAEHDAAKTIRPVAWAGYDSGYIANANLSWSEDTERGQGPAGIVFRRGEIVYVQDFKTDSLMVPWRKAALERGYRSGIALPLKDKSSKVFGALLIYSAEVNAITPDELWLMEELAGNLAFGITSLHERAEKKRIQEKLKLLSLYNRSLIEASLDPLVTIGPDGKITDVNKATENVTGYSRDKLIGTDFSDYFTEPDKAREGYQQVFEESFVRDYPLEIQHKDGGITSVLYNASVYKDESEEVIGVFAAARDITKRVKAEEKIKMLANVVESSDDAIITKSLEGRITSWNKGAELIYGYSAEEVLGEDISILAPPELNNEVKHLIENIKHGEHVLHYETTRLRKNGKKINVSLTLSPIFDSAEKLVGISTIARDTTQRKRDEEKLQKSEEKYRTLFEESFDGLFITSPEGKILDMNKKGIEMFGYDNKEEILRLDLEKDVYADPSDRKRILDMVNKQGSAEYEIVVKKKNGEKMITYCSLTAVKDENGVINSYRGIIRDITKRKKDEDAIIRAKEEWEKTFDAVPDLIAILDTNYHVTRANKAMANRLGVSPEDAVGVTCYEVVHGLNEPPSFCPHSRLLEDGQDHTAEVHENRIGGDFIVSVSPLYDSEGKLMGSVHVARDITDRKKAEDKVKKSLKEKEILLGEIHHRVKNNMQIISSLLNLQTQYVTAEETVDVLHESQDRVKAMATVYEKAYLSEDLTKINFKSYIQSLVQALLYSYLIKQDQITFLIEIEDILLNIETAIPCGLIISELVSNSLKHAFPGERKGEIKVSLESFGEKYELLISDNGVGLPKNVDFKNTNTLGLKLVNNLVDQIDGEINLDRSNGTEFKITFKELLYKKRI